MTSDCLSWPHNRARVFSLAALGFALVFAAGCGGGKTDVPLIKVTGTVKVGGAPLQMGTVEFHPDANKGNTFKAKASGTIKPDGTYLLVTDTKEGAPAGWYMVSISGQGMPDPSKMPEPGKATTTPALNAKYTKPETSGFSFEVKEGAPAGAYDLSLLK